jgi:Tfp pilus assembly protein PilV
MKKGGTLIEVMMACVVLAVIALAGGAYVAQTRKTMSGSRAKSIALAIANSQLEKFRATNYASLTNTYPYPGNAVVFLTQGVAVTNIIQYWDAPQNPDGLYEALLITVQVPYGIGSQKDSVTLQTLFAH